MLDLNKTVLATAVAFALPAVAQAQSYDLSQIIEVQLLEGWRQSDGRHMSALDIRLAPGWKTYWRSPGDGGIPTSLMLDQSVAQLHWPSPDVFYTGGLRSIGYASDVLLPVELHLDDGTHTVRGTVELGVCQDVCMPVTLALEAVLPDGGRPDPRIIAALSDRPLSAAEAGVAPAVCSLRPIADGMQVEVHIPMRDSDGGEEVVLELPDPQIWISDPSTSHGAGNIVAVADIVPPDAGPFALDRSELRITVLAQGRAVELMGCSAS